MIHTNLPRNCMVFLLLCKLTWLAIYGSQKFDSHKWPTVVVDEVKGKPCSFEVCLCGPLYYTFTTSFYPYAFDRNYKRLQRPTWPIQRVPLKVHFAKCPQLNIKLTQLEDNGSRKLTLNFYCWGAVVCWEISKTMSQQ